MMDLFNEKLREYIKQNHKIECTSNDYSSDVAFSVHNCFYYIEIDGPKLITTIRLNAKGRSVNISTDLCLGDPKLFPKIDSLIDFGVYAHCLQTVMMYRENAELIIRRMLPLCTLYFLWY